MLPEYHLLIDVYKRQGIDGVNQIWREAKLRAVGKARAKTLIEAAEHSVDVYKRQSKTRAITRWRHRVHTK